MAASVGAFGTVGRRTAECQEQGEGQAIHQGGNAAGEDRDGAKPEQRQGVGRLHWREEFAEPSNQQPKQSGEGGGQQGRERPALDAGGHAAVLGQPVSDQAAEHGQHEPSCQTECHGGLAAVRQGEKLAQENGLYAMGPRTEEQEGKPDHCQTPGIWFRHFGQRPVVPIRSLTTFTSMRSIRRASQRSQRVDDRGWSGMFSA